MTGETIPTARLEAFVDGELSPEDAAAVLMHLAASPADRDYVERLERIDSALIDLYAAPLALPVPEELRRRILGSGTEWKRAAPVRPGPRQAWLFAGAATAAAVALAVGLSLPRDPRQPGFQVRTGTVDPGAPLQEALDRQPSGTPRAEGDDVVLLVVGTFFDGNGRPCREFEAVRTAEREIEQAVACRRPAGAWHVELAVTQPLVEDASSETSYAPAEGPGKAALDAALNALGAGMFLSADEENRLLASDFAARR
jgi:Putative zinc-finger